MSEDDVVGPPLNSELIYGDGPKVLGEMYRRREAGASLDDLRRDTAVDSSVSDRHLESCVEGGRWVTEQQRYGRVRPKRRYFGGIDLPTGQK